MRQGGKLPGVAALVHGVTGESVTEVEWARRYRREEAAFGAAAELLLGRSKHETIPEFPHLFAEDIILADLRPQHVTLGARVAEAPGVGGRASVLHERAATVVAVLKRLEAEEQICVLRVEHLRLREASRFLFLWAALEYTSFRDELLSGLRRAGQRLKKHRRRQARPPPR